MNRRSRIPVLATLALAGVALPVSTLQAQGLEELVESKLGAVPSGAVVGVYHEGELLLLRAWGHPSHETTDTLTSRALFPFAGFTEILIAATARALSAAGSLDVDAPIGRYLPDLAPPLDRITVDELLRNTAGLDDAAIPPDATLSDVVASLGPEAMLAAPGVIYSRSRYSYPLAARVLETASGLPLEKVIETALLKPLGMEMSTFDRARAEARGLAVGYVPTGDTVDVRATVDPRDVVDGLPVLYTNIPEIIQFFAAWMGGEIAGGPGALPPPPDFPAMEDPVVDGFVRGSHQLLVELERSMSGLGHGVVVRVYPETRSAVAAWANSQHPGTGLTDPFGAATLPWEAATYVGDRILGPDIPVTVTESPPDTTEPRSGPDRVPLWAWAGRYLNGDRMIVLRPPETDGLDAELVFFNGTSELPLERLEDGSVLARLPDDGRPALRFRLLRDRAGRRYVFLAGKAYALVEG
ncbi:MAG: serine hydrolase domain-containing protein [Gemmatimonadota bacterium]